MPETVGTISHLWRLTVF